MRHHIDFIQAQHLSWQDAGPFGFPRGRAKLLSRDEETGAFSIVLQLPAGAAQAAAPLAFDEELYVLDGAVSAGGADHAEHGYAFLPAGLGRDALRSRDGAVLLYFRSGEVAPSLRSDADKVAARHVAKVDTSDGKWDDDFEKFNLGSMKAGARMRVLREDPFSGEVTYMTATTAFRRGVRAERHPIVQEFYLLAGELAGELGVMQAGAYCFRPPMAKHGPYGSPTGALIFFRGLGGRHETFWEDTDPFTFRPPHRPIVPDHLKAVAGPYPRPPRY